MKSQRDVIYIDPEEDITSVIDRINSASANIVALVLPKRAGVLNSNVNIRLLKKAADSRRKHLVLISADPSVVRLAAMAGLYIADSLNSKPYLPKQSDIHNGHSSQETVNHINKSANNQPIDAKSTAALNKNNDALDFDNAGPDMVSGKDAKVKKNRKLKVPSIDRFRRLIFIGGGAIIILVIVFFIALFVMPKSTIIVKTEMTSLETKFDFVANTAVKTNDNEKYVLMAQLKESKRSLTEKIQATGEVEKGNKAIGKVTLFNCRKDDKPVNLATGSRLVVAGLGFVTDATVTIPASNFTGGGVCKKDKFVDVAVTAEKGGDKYNISERPGYVAESDSFVVGSGDNMTGGTSKLVKAISQADVDLAKDKISKITSDKDKDELAETIRKANLYPLVETFTMRTGEPVASPKVGEEAAEGILTAELSFQMLSLNKGDLESILNKVQESNITTATQKIYDNGFSKISIGLLERKNTNEAKLSVTASAKVGPRLDAISIAKEVAGKSGGETMKVIKSRPGIKDVEVQYSPFWVYKTPSRLNKITLIFDGEGAVQ